MNTRLPAASCPAAPDWSRWHRHFAMRARRPLPALDAMPALPAGAREALARSLAIFQLGESGEGRIAHQVDKARLDGIDGEYRAALKLFVAEEGRHGRILGQMVRAMGGELLGRSWTEGLFRHGRRLMGIRLKLLVLLAAEVIAVVFYAAIAARLPRGPLRAALEEIVADEDHHLAFHAGFFRTQTPRAPQRLLFSLGWWMVGTAACLVVAWDHRRTLDQLGVRRLELLRACMQEIRRAEAAVIGTGADPVAAID